MLKYLNIATEKSFNILFSASFFSIKDWHVYLSFIIREWTISGEIARIRMAGNLKIELCLFYGGPGGGGVGAYFLLPIPLQWLFSLFLFD